METTAEENEKKKRILLEHYSFNEICDIIGYDDESNEDVATAEMKRLEIENYPEFVSKILDSAIINGNFEDIVVIYTPKPICPECKAENIEKRSGYQVCFTCGHHF